jgi:hypothetical protein
LRLRASGFGLRASGFGLRAHIIQICPLFVSLICSKARKFPYISQNNVFGHKNTLPSPVFTAIATDSGVFCRQDALTGRPDALFCRPDALFCRPDALFCRQDALFCRQDALTGRQDALICRPDALTGRPDALFCRQDAPHETSFAAPGTASGVSATVNTGEHAAAPYLYSIYRGGKDAAKLEVKNVA